MEGVATRSAAIIVAAGRGERLGAEVPKAFLSLRGRSLLALCLEAFRAVVDDIVVVAPATHLPLAQKVVSAAEDAQAAVCPGGVRRQDSVRAGLAACPDDVEVIAVHDAARPLISPALIRRALDALTPTWDAVAPAIEVVDTLKVVDDGRVVETLDRGRVRAVQTPQVFRAPVLRAAHEAAEDATVTDDLALVEAAGAAVRLVPGDRRNLKITYADDLRVAEALL